MEIAEPRVMVVGILGCEKGECLMALINVPFAPGSSPGERTSDFAALNANRREHIYSQLSARMCWDSVLLCAWSVKGIHCGEVDLAKIAYGVVEATSFKRMFGETPLEVTSASQLASLPKGAMIGFVRKSDGKEILRHAMIHIADGWGAGNKNDCVLSAGHSIGWERLDMGAFFSSDSKYNNNTNTRMIYAEVIGQKL